MAKLTPREAVARIFPTYDRQMADRAIAWLDECGYQTDPPSRPSAVRLPVALPERSAPTLHESSVKNADER